MNFDNSCSTTGAVVPSIGKPSLLCEPIQITEKNLRNFWAKVYKSESCWEWTASKDACGYGMFGIDGHGYRAHRLSYYLKFGPIPIGILVLHHCDNPCCVNVAHLFLGTQTDNMHDMESKGRSNKARGERSAMRLHPELVRRGEKHHKALLNAEQVAAIRTTFNGSNGNSLAAQFGVSSCTIRDIVKRRSWTHL